jgi:histidine ammonia-lyase
MIKNDTLFLSGHSLTIEDVYRASVQSSKVELTIEAKAAIKRCRTRLLEKIKNNPIQKIYGVNVGVGNLKDTFISPEETEKFQIKYIKSHNCGTGEALPIAVVRAMMIIRLNSFAQGVSAISLETVEMIELLLNKNVIPLVLTEGSVGASGDLVPLAMIAGVMIGLPESKAWFNGELISAVEALRLTNLKPVKLGFKEAMGLTNGTNFMSANSIFASIEAHNLLKTANLATAFSVEAIRGEKDAFCSFLAERRPHSGLLETAKDVLNHLEGSKRTTPEAQKVQFKGQDICSVSERVQDRYCFRAVPPVHGAAIEA